MAFDEFGLGATWKDEEEERRRRLLSVGLGTGMHSAPALPTPAKSRVSRAPRNENRYVPLEERESSFFREESKRATLYIAQQKKAHKSHLTEYFSLANKLGGQDKVAIRLAAIHSLWNVYAKDYDGRNAVWQLLKSPYDIDTIEGMLRKGGASLYAAPTKAHQAIVPASFAKATGVTQNDWLGAAWATHYANLDRVQGRESFTSFIDDLTRPPEAGVRVHRTPRMLDEGQTNEDLLSGYFAGAEATRREVTEEEAKYYKYALEATALGLPIGKLLTPALRGGKVLALAAKGGQAMIRGVQTFPAVTTGATEYFGWRAQQAQERIDEAFRQGTQIPREAAMNPFLDPAVDYTMKQTNPMYKTLDDMKSLVLNLDEPDAKAVQEWMLKNGYAENLDADGKWTWTWIDKVINLAEEEQRNMVEKQKIYMEMGAAPYWAKIGAPMSDPVWQQAEALVSASRAAQAALERDHIYLSYGANAGNVPQSAAEWTMWMNRMGAEGLPQAFLKAPLQAALIAGGAVQGGFSALNLYSRMSNNPRYQTAMQNLMAYVDAKPYTYAAGSPFTSKPSEPNAAFATYQVTNGEYKDDSQAQALLAEVDKEVGRMMAKPGTPDYLLTAANLLGVPYDMVEKFGQDHSDFIHASTLTFDVAAAVANPLGKTIRAARPRIAVGEFGYSRRATNAVGRVASALADGNVGRATMLVKGSQAGDLIRAVYHLKGKSKRLDPNSEVVVDLAKEIKRNLDQNNAHGVARAVNANVKFADDITKVAVKARADWKGNTLPAFKTKKDGATGKRQTALTEDEAVLAAIKKKLTARQNKHGDVFTKENIEPTLRRVATDAYAELDVFPYFRTKGQKVLSLRERASDVFNQAVAGIEHVPTRVFLTEMIGTKLRYAPMIEKEFGAWNTLDRAYDAALLISGDARWANDFRSRMAMAKSDAALRRLGTQLEAKFKERFATRQRGAKLQDWADRLSEGGKSNLDEYGPEGALTVRPELDAPMDDRVLGAYKSGDTLKQVVPSEAQQAYKMNLSRQALFAPYRTPKEAGLLVRGFYRTRNAVRGATWTAHTLSQPLRRYTVAMGGLLLFQKHALTDTFRAEMEAPGTMVLKVSGRLKKQYEGNIDQLTPQMRDRILAEENATYHSEMQYNSGNVGIKWIAQPIRGKDGKLVNPAESAQSLRRIVQSEPYRVWARGEQEGPVRSTVIPENYDDYQYTRATVEDAATRTWYHGSGSTVDEFTAYRGRGVQNLYGPGLYMTDSPHTAFSYGTKKNKGSVVNEVEIQLHPSEILDLREVPTGAVADAVTVWLKTLEDIIDVDGLDGLTLGEVYREVSKRFSHEGMTVDAVADAVAPLHVHLADAGKKALLHDGGKLTKGPSHNVLILLEDDYTGSIQGYKSHKVREVPQKTTVEFLGGEAALRKWFGTKEGKRFLARNAHYAKARTFADELGQKLKGKDMHNKAVEEFIDEFTLKQWVPLEAQLENVMPALKRMSLNDEFLDLKAIEKLLEDNPDDNAVLNTKYEQIGASGYAGYLVGKAMYMNKLNRKVLFRRTFNSEFKRLTKEGMDADTAARVASTLGSMTVNKVMFDLANAMTTEAKHRWFAWFGTKHRLYATYMGKLAIERPTLAAAVLEIQAWMEERNADKEVGDFDRYDLVFNIPSWVPVVGGQQASMNLAPYMWFADYPLESSLGQMVERVGVGVINMAAGKELVHPSPNPFGYSTGRWDATFMAYRDLATSPIAARAAKGDVLGTTLTDDAATEWIQRQDPDKAARWNRLVHMQMAIALAQGEGEISIATAFERAMWSNVKYESWKMMRPYSGKIVGQPATKVQEGLKEFFELSNEDSEKGYEFLRTRPDVQRMLNASMNPIEKRQLDDFRYQLSQINDDTALAVEQSFAMGTLVDDAKDIMKRHQDAIDRLTQPQYDEYNKVGAEWYHGAEPEAFRNALQLMVPLVPVDDMIRTGKVRTEQEVNEYEETELKPAFEQKLQSAGLAPGDTSQPLYKMFKRDYVNEPLAKFLGRNAGDYSTWYEESAARYLARGGKDGVFKQDQFLATVRDRHLRELMTKGIRDGMGAKSDPFLAYMSTGDKEAIGWNSNPKAQEGWYQWAYEHWQLRKYTRENGISATSKAGKQLWAEFEESARSIALKNPGFGTEWEFSRMPLDERMEFFGVGSGGDQVSKGWRDFLSISRSHRDALSEVVVPSTRQVGVGPRAQSAAPTTAAYAAQIALLAKSNNRWWEEFRRSFTLSKFGFYWRTPDTSDDFLYWGEKDMPMSSDFVSETPWEVWEE